MLAGGSVDPYNGKAVRASAGSLFHLPVVRGADLAAALAAARAAGLTVLAADGAGEDDLDELADRGALAAPTAWLFGNEAWGLPDDRGRARRRRVRIPISPRAESLNLAAAAAVCLFASARSLRPGPAGAAVRGRTESPDRRPAVALTTRRVLCPEAHGHRAGRRTGPRGGTGLLDTYDELPDGVLVAGPDGRVSTLNRAGRRLLGLTRDAAVGRDYRDVLPLADTGGSDWWSCIDPYRGLRSRTGHPERLLELRSGSSSGRELLVSARYVRDRPRGPVRPAGRLLPGHPGPAAGRPGPGRPGVHGRARDPLAADHA